MAQQDSGTEAAVLSEAQSQTQQTFAFKWKRRDTYESGPMLAEARRWLLERYFGGNEAAVDLVFADGTRVLDAGCGAGYSAVALLSDRLERLDYVGADISAAAGVARDRFRERGLRGSFVQADLVSLPFPDGSFDVVFSEGVLHHTDSTRAALAAVTRLVRVDGRVMFYVYRRKGPIREFTDDFVRQQISSMSDEEAWDALRPLTRLGRTLGELGVTVHVPEDIPVLQIPSGDYDLQRFFYWHVIKAFYRPEYTEDEMLHINFDWFRPTNAHRHTSEEVLEWCSELSLDVERCDVQDSGITIVARKRQETE